MFIESKKYNIRINIIIKLISLKGSQASSSIKNVMYQLLFREVYSKCVVYVIL